jgi:hypothetical protein
MGLEREAVSGPDASRPPVSVCPDAVAVNRGGLNPEVLCTIAVKE